jgi:hypothetical protein
MKNFAWAFGPPIDMKITLEVGGKHYQFRETFVCTADFMTPSPRSARYHVEALPVPKKSRSRARIRRHAFPWRASAAGFPPILAVPGLGRYFHRLRFESVMRVSGHGVEAPDLLAGFRIVGRDIAACSIL